MLTQAHRNGQWCALIANGYTVTRGFLPTQDRRNKGMITQGLQGCVHMHYNWVHGGSCIECVGVPTRDFTDTNNYLFEFKL